jgi:hypothetical protein
VHDHAERRPVGDPLLAPAVVVLIFRCASSKCGATWRILPRFLARHLWHAWGVIERVVKPQEQEEPAIARPVSVRTEQRWRRRLSSCGRQLAVLFAMAGGVLAELAAEVGQWCTRGALVEGFVKLVGPPPGLQLSALATVVHRLERGIRLM